MFVLRQVPDTFAECIYFSPFIFDLPLYHFQLHYMISKLETELSL